MPLITSSATDHISYRLTPVVWAALVVFFLANAAAILQMRGVADPQGFILNTSKAIPVNTYEDDAQVSIMHALWYFGPTTNTFDVATNFGGPLLHLAKPVMWLGMKLGWIKRFDDRCLYVLYPNELARIFKLFAFYKLCLLMLLPISIFWLMNNFFSRRAGEIATWFVVGMPFLTAFELRLKPEGVVFALTMLSLVHQLAFNNTAKKKNLYLAVIFFSLGAAMKFTMATAIFTLLACFFNGTRRSGRSVLDASALKTLAGAGVAGVAVFIASNPRIIPGLLIFVDFVRRYTSIPNTATVRGGMLETFWFRMTHFGPLLGRALGLFAIPSLGLAVYESIRRKKVVTPWSCLAALYILQMFFLWIVAHNHVIFDVTYYYYSQALLTIILIALFCDKLLDLSTLGCLSWRLATWSLVFVLMASTFVQNLSVLDFLSGPSTRQSAQAWIDRNIPTGASLGLPLSPGRHLTFNDRFLVDPYRQRIVSIGTQGEFVGKALPDYVLWVRSNPLQPRFERPGYERIAFFDDGRHLPREPYNFYQDDIYEIFKRTGAGPDSPVPGPADADAALGAALAAVHDQSFNLIQYHASGIFPLDLTVLMHANEHFLPLGKGQFLSAVRHPSSAPTYLHQLNPELLILWGVRYVLVRQDEAFTEDFRTKWGSFLQPVDPPVLLDFPEGVKLYRFVGYKGMAHFLPAPRQDLRASIEPRWFGLLKRHRIKTYGTLFPEGHADSGAGLLRVRMTVDCEGAMDLLLKGGGAPASLFLGPGRNKVDFPLAVQSGVQPGYELNPATSGSSCDIRLIQVEPLAIEPAQCWSASPERAFASVDAGSDGHVLFALPYHPFWDATVDGADVPAERGPGDTVMVAVGQGHHLVGIRFAGGQ
jgi:hypothetical protein